MDIYEGNLSRFQRAVSDPTLIAIQTYLTALAQTMRPISVHQHYRCLRAFFGWCVEAALLPTDPTLGLAMRVPKTLPRVPDDEDVRRLIRSCPNTFEGHRNLNFGQRTIAVRGGKGGKDATGFFGAEAMRHVRAWLAKRRGAPEDFVFVDRTGRSMSRYHALHILHALSDRAGLSRRIGPHALRHYAATAILKQTGDLELVRQVLRHETLAMALKYARLTQTEVSAKFRRASPLDNLRVGE